MRALISGSDGFLGANLAKYLQLKGHDVIGTALNRKHNTSLDALNVHLRVEYGDVTDIAFVKRVINAYEVEWVFHLAAVAIVRIAADNPVRAINTNVLGTLNMLEACSSTSKVKSIVVASSDKAYGDYGGLPYVETMSLKPTGAYEVSKACADLITQMYGQNYNLRAMVTRCANLYGPGDMNFSRLIPNSCRKALNGEAPVVHSGVWHNLREWLYVEDACSAYETLAERGEAGTYNVGSGELHRAGEIAEMISFLAGAPRATEVLKDTNFYEIPTQQLDSTKIRCAGWQPEISFANGIGKTLNWYREYLK